MSKYNLVIDVAECTNCNLCTLATMDEYVGNDHGGDRGADAAARPPLDRDPAEGARAGADDRHRLRADDLQPLRRRAVHEGGEGAAAISKREDGIVVIDPVRAKGQKSLVDACPYGHIWWNEELQVPQAWPFDAHLLDQGWPKTRGAQSCPTGAMKVVKVDDEEMQRMVRAEGLEVMKPELGTRPRVYYKNLWRYATCFVGGSVSEDKSGVVDCVEGARVRLLKDGREVGDGGDRQLRRLQARPASGEFRRLHARDRARRPHRAPRGDPGRKRQSRRDPGLKMRLFRF